MTTLDTLNTEALYVPGLRFWSSAEHPSRFGLVAQNARGAVEIWHARKDPTVGAVVAHLPQPREGYELAMGCTFLGGPCFTRDSFPAYSGDFLPLITAGRDEDVLKQLAAWHDQVFAGTRVTA